MKKNEDNTAIGEIGDKVHVVETCKQGCCEESNYKGIIVGLEQNGSYQIISDRNIDRLQELKSGEEWKFVNGGVSARDFKFIEDLALKPVYAGISHERGVKPVSLEIIKTIIEKKQNDARIQQTNAIFKHINLCYNRGYDEDFPSMRFEIHAETCERCTNDYLALKPLLANLPEFKWMKKNEVKFQKPSLIDNQMPGKTRFQLLEIE